MNRSDMASAASVAASAAPLLVLYLANVHPVFAEGRTWLLAVFTPLSFGIVAVLVVLAGRLGPSLVVLASGIPLFYWLQTSWTTVVRHRSGPAGVRLTMPYVVCLLTILVCGVVAATTLSLGPRLVGAALVAAAGLSATAARLRRERRA